jgi:hypothetical protein
MAPQADPAKSGRSWHELLATVLLVVTAVATSWSSYQATRWNGEQAAAAGRTNAIRVQAARAAALGQAQTQIDVATFIAWADADRGDDSELADFYVERFRAEFEPAFEAWVATSPLTSSTAPRTPFEMPEYKVAARDEAGRLDVAAEASATQVARNIQRASNYVLTVVLYAVVLFFAGVSMRMTSRRLRTIMVAAGYLVLGATLTWIATFPVSLKV